MSVRINGQLIGGSCVIDGHTRSWSAEQVDPLQQIANAATREIQLRLPRAGHHGHPHAAEIRRLMVA